MPTPTPTSTDPTPAQFGFAITRQPNESTCGPACLHAVYRYYEDTIPLAQVIDEVDMLPTGGTLAVFLARHALSRGYRATIYTCNLLLFDPTWFDHPDPAAAGPAVAPARPDIRRRMEAQSHAKADPTLRAATEAYIDYLDAGGELYMADLSQELLTNHLRRRQPVIAGLSATWLYRCVRERPSDWADDDAAGEPLGHFVVLHGSDPCSRTIDIADPYLHAPTPGSHHYTVPADRAIGAILLGIVTYDAKLLIISPREAEGG